MHTIQDKLVSKQDNYYTIKHLIHSSVEYNSYIKDKIFEQQREIYTKNNFDEKQ